MSVQSPVDIDMPGRDVVNANKLAKEAFVSGLHGGSVYEVHLITAIAPITVFAWSVLQSRLSFFTPGSPVAILVDFLLHCGVTIATITLYADHHGILNYLLLIPALLCVMGSSKPKTSPDSGVHASKNITPNPFPVKPFITAHRSTMMLSTCIAILAVDFRVFPRRFAKVENWGTSFMDLGVGSFVFVAGLVAARPILKQQSTYGRNSLVARLKSSLRHAFPLAVLGFIRLYSVKGLDYQEHVTEYGVHWNFFFTLSFIPPLVAVFDAAFSILPSYAAFALIVSVVHELLLNFTNLGTYIFTAPRTDLLSQNREGIFSLFGYLAIFLAGQSTGMYTLPRKKGRYGTFEDPAFWKLFNWSVVWILLYLISTSYALGFNLTVSRRLTNLPYFLWIAAFNTAQLTVLNVIENFLFPNIYTPNDPQLEKKRIQRATSQLLAAFNRNGLAIFLLANLGTGLVNMTMNTLEMSDLEAVCVLMAYLASLSAVALILDAKNISIKL